MIRLDPPRTDGSQGSLQTQPHGGGLPGLSSDTAEGQELVTCLSQAPGAGGQPWVGS